MSELHIPVMLKEVLQFLNPGSGKRIVDATAGTGGHARAILERITPGGELIAIDRDQSALDVCRSQLKDFEGSFKLTQGSFADIGLILKSLKVRRIDGVLFDLGLSTYQLKDPRRGFSFQKDGPLDMRFDRDSRICACDLVNNLHEDELSLILRDFGQERWHRRIAHFLAQERKKQPILTTAQLVNIVVRSIPVRFRQGHWRRHPATRTFQALRIAVNRELEILEGAIFNVLPFLKKGGRICVISFHSLEDRIVKFAFRRAHSEGVVNIITPKPLVPAEEEVRSNPASRSSKLRVAEKI